jgi:hypothetical protein
MNECNCNGSVVHEDEHVSCFNSPLNNSCPFKNAIKNRHLRCFEFAHQNGSSNIDETICQRAAESGEIDILIYAHTNGFPWDKSTCIAAAENGHVSCLQYAIDNGCPFNIDECIGASNQGFMDFEEMWGDMDFFANDKRYANIVNILWKKEKELKKKSK